MLRLVSVGFSITNRALFACVFLFPPLWLECINHLSTAIYLLAILQGCKFLLCNKGSCIVPLCPFDVLFPCFIEKLLSVAKIRELFSQPTSATEFLHSKGTEIAKKRAFYFLVTPDVDLESLHKGKK